MSRQQFGPSQHQYLAPNRHGPAEAALQVRQAIAARAGVDVREIYLSHDGDTLLCRVLQAVISAGERVAVALPDADDHVRQLLAIGAAYVDMGCDQHFRPRGDRLTRLLEDEAVAGVLVSRVNPITGGRWAPVLPAPLPVWFVDDQRGLSQGAPTRAQDLRHIVLRGGGLGAPAWAIADPRVVERLELLAPGPAVSPDALADKRSDSDVQPAPLKADWEQLANLGLNTSASDAQWALVHRAGKDAAWLAKRCDSAQLTYTQSDHPTWRGALRMEWPGAAGLKRLAEMLAAVTLVLLVATAAACEPPRSQTPAAQAPRSAKTRPAPAIERPAPTVTSSSKSTADTAPPQGVAKALHRNPIVGGCGRLCQNPRDAVVGFAAALVAGDRASRLPRYLDTSQLVVDGDKLGDRLGHMWLSGQHSPRLQAIGQLVDRLAKAAAGTDEAALLAAAEQVGFVEELPRKAIVKLALPPSHTTWTLTIGRRGLEWLVVGISTGAAEN